LYKIKIPTNTLLKKQIQILKTVLEKDSEIELAMHICVTSNMPVPQAMGESFEV